MAIPENLKPISYQEALLTSKRILARDKMYDSLSIEDKTFLLQIANQIIAARKPETNPKQKNRSEGKNRRKKRTGSRRG